MAKTHLLPVGMGARGTFAVRGPTGRRSPREIYTRMVSVSNFPQNSTKFALCRSQFPLGHDCMLIRDLCLIVVRFLNFKDVCAVSACSRAALELCVACLETMVPEPFREVLIGSSLGVKVAVSLWIRSDCDSFLVLKCFDFLYDALSLSGDVMDKNEACEDAVWFSESCFLEAQLAESDPGEEAGIDVAGFLSGKTMYMQCSLSFEHASKLMLVCKKVLGGRSEQLTVLQTVGVIELMAFLHHALHSLGPRSVSASTNPEGVIDFDIS